MGTRNYPAARLVGTIRLAGPRKPPAARLKPATGAGSLDEHDQLVRRYGQQKLRQLARMGKRDEALARSIRHLACAGWGCDQCEGWGWLRPTTGDR